MESLTQAERAEKLKEREQAVQDQLDRIYTLVQEGKPVSFVKIEYKRLVERMTEKYHLLFLSLDIEKKNIPSEDYEAQRKALQEQYKSDVVSAAAAIDVAMKADTSRGSDQSTNV